MTKPADSAETKTEINKVAIKLSPFWKNDPVIWFTRLEA